MLPAHEKAAGLQDVLQADRPALPQGHRRLPSSRKAQPRVVPSRPRAAYRIDHGSVGRHPGVDVDIVASGQRIRGLVNGPASGRVGAALRPGFGQGRRLLRDRLVQPRCRHPAPKGGQRQGDHSLQADVPPRNVLAQPPTQIDHHHRKGDVPPQDAHLGRGRLEQIVLGLEQGKHRHFMGVSDDVVQGMAGVHRKGRRFGIAHGERHDAIAHPGPGRRQGRPQKRGHRGSRRQQQFPDVADGGMGGGYEPLSGVEDHQSPVGHGRHGPGRPGQHGAAQFPGHRRQMVGRIAAGHHDTAPAGQPAGRLGRRRRQQGNDGTRRRGHAVHLPGHMAHAAETSPGRGRHAAMVEDCRPPRRAMSAPGDAGRTRLQKPDAVVAVHGIFQVAERSGQSLGRQAQPGEPRQLLRGEHRPVLVFRGHRFPPDQAVRSGHGPARLAGQLGHDVGRLVPRHPKDIHRHGSVDRQNAEARHGGHEHALCLRMHRIYGERHAGSPWGHHPLNEHRHVQGGDRQADLLAIDHGPFGECPGHDLGKALLQILGRQIQFGRVLTGKGMFGTVFGQGAAAGGQPDRGLPAGGRRQPGGRRPQIFCQPFGQGSGQDIPADGVTGGPQTGLVLQRRPQALADGAVQTRFVQELPASPGRDGEPVRHRKAVAQQQRQPGRLAAHFAHIERLGQGQARGAPAALLHHLQGGAQLFFQPQLARIQGIGAVRDKTGHAVDHFKGHSQKVFHQTGQFVGGPGGQGRLNLAQPGQGPLVVGQQDAECMIPDL